MFITYTLFNILILLYFPAPGQHNGHSTFVGPLYQPTNPADWAHRADLGTDFYAR
jgi:hypothetical protein